MQPESAKLLQDIFDAANRIGGYVSGKNRDEFVNCNELCDAVHWNLQLSGKPLISFTRLIRHAQKGSMNGVA